MKDFHESIQSLLVNEITIDQRDSKFHEIIVMADECAYLIDYNKNALIFKKGFNHVLGYQDKEVNLELLTNGYHPGDKDVITRVIREAILFTLNDPFNGTQNRLSLKYRRKKKDGSYITVLSQTNLYRDKDNSLKSFTRLTDISFTNDDNSISYMFYSKDIEPEVFKERIHSAYFGFFTDREMQVIMQMKNGLTSKQIAKVLSISELTVATHRKNIFRKSNCHNSSELMNFCRMNGVF
jgi:DNA-binding CsgD family transcriptional regulator